ncbi:MAG: phosphatase PAP2 family protein [Bacteroidota bacterium]
MICTTRELNPCFRYGSHPRHCRGWLFLVLWIGSLFQIQAQEESPYQIHRSLDISLGASALTLATTSYLLSLQVDPLTSSQLASLSPTDIPGFDRSATNTWRPGIAKASDVLLIGGMLSPGLFIFSRRIRSDIGVQLLMGAETYFSTFALTQTTKLAVLRNRPLTYISTNDPELLAIQMKPSSRFSFFSGHTSMAATMCWYTASVYDQYFPRSSARPLVWAAAASVPAVVGWMRVRSGKHFATDVIVGYLVGAGIGWLIPRLHRKRK